MNEDLEDIKNYIQRYCYKYEVDGFKLSSGKMSQHYFDLRKLLLAPEMNKIVSKQLIYKIECLDKVLDIKTNCIGGLTMGADPITYGLAFHSNMFNKQPLFPLIIRKESKSHGTSKIIEGTIPKNPQCVVVDDVITTGGSTIKAIDALRDAGVSISYIYCILDREEGGKQAVQNLGYNLYSLFKKSDFGIGN